MPPDIEEEDVLTDEAKREEYERVAALQCDEMVRRFELADPRDRWRHTGEPRPVEGMKDCRLVETRARPEQVDVELPDALPLTVDGWRKRDLPEPDLLLGSWISTTSRVLLSAATGLGKSNLAIALGQHVAAGKSFLHWKAGRAAKVLYIDGEMSRRLLRQRLLSEADRHGHDVSNFYGLSREDVPGFQPLNSPVGQAWIIKQIEQLGVELVIFDNIMSLTVGDMKEELSWTQTMPLVLALTAKAIGQIWVHHTGHDETKGYGTKTREWQLDTVIHLQSAKRRDTDVSFTLSFRKARERTPSTRADFQDAKVALVNDRWEHETAEAIRSGKVSPRTQRALDALIAVLTSDQAKNPSGNRRPVHRDHWASECNAQGLIDLKGKPKSARTLMNTFRRELASANLIAYEGDMQWLIG
ncbi:AAA family ATPase [Bradyrhizobium sp. Ash2021]|uniref:AAA family ATPase n=1 Tax=Bradyrhizobium sp. Ash2021 TaxID=2954771 RepID=UPI0028158934|nr:AAA family ATPase [Bradyrhizobium sp. Ash2021]WMT71066.1 AAA family ATPase [Bradyrhizobium sp. Ash2021]